MAPHILTQGRPRRPPLRAAGWNGVIQLGWAHFWLLSGILGGFLALVVLIVMLAPAGFWR